MLAEIMTPPGRHGYACVGCHQGILGSSLLLQELQQAYLSAAELFLDRPSLTAFGIARYYVKQQVSVIRPWLEVRM